MNCLGTGLCRIPVLVDISHTSVQKGRVEIDEKVVEKVTTEKNSRRRRPGKVDHIFDQTADQIKTVLKFTRVSPRGTIVWAETLENVFYHRSFVRDTA
mgnify:CR=1 FL=1